MWSPQAFVLPAFPSSETTAPQEVRRSADELIRGGTLPPHIRQLAEGLLASPDRSFNTLQGQLSANDVLAKVVDQYSPQSVGALGGPLFSNAQPTSWDPRGGDPRTERTEPQRDEQPQDDFQLGDRLLQAVAGQESGGDPTVINTDAASADTEYGIGAIGRYQMLGTNVANWSQEAADAGVIPQDIAKQLKADPKAITGMPEIQDQIAAFKMEQYYQSAKDQGYTDDDAVRFVAAAWYSGDGNNLNSDAPQAGYPSIRQYTEEVLEKFKNA
jgi:hypothetical protein